MLMTSSGLIPLCTLLFRSAPKIPHHPLLLSLHEAMTIIVNGSIF